MFFNQRWQQILAGFLLFSVTSIAYLWFSTQSHEISPEKEEDLAEQVDQTVTSGIAAENVFRNPTEPAEAKSADPTPLLLRRGSHAIQPGQKGQPIELAGLDRLERGDWFAFYVPQEDSVFEAQVEDVSFSEAGNRSIVGATRIDGRLYRQMFTLGTDLSFGTIHTPGGAYQLRTQAGQGRIVSTRTIVEQLDYSKPDYVISEPRQLPENSANDGG